MNALEDLANNQSGHISFDQTNKQGLSYVINNMSCPKYVIEITYNYNYY